ncbi:hypothetical protein [Streptantibioticus ferralitis]|uniref:SRPBCC family protein n=1 Tax=Streptantibioticus ferralitis TaxID=236510 RepID=A0ABT5Z3L6_9ACTN|nr:hypothetical protein [Streptantibioticus ferralitis]MDF2258358.1 hypothetical protein [Streptantibioticus ferralitis]
MNDDLARDWLTNLIVAYEIGEDFGASSPMVSAHTPPLKMAWTPQDPGEEDSVHLLIRAAQTDGVVTGPQAVNLKFEYVDDGDEGYYRFLLHITTPTSLTLATLSEGIAMLGEPDTSGIEAALSILREAVQAANLLLQQLSEFVAASISRGG